MPNNPSAPGQESFLGAVDITRLDSLFSAEEKDVALRATALTPH